MPDPSRWRALLVIALAQLMVVLDGTIVNIALPSIQRDLGISDVNRQWIITAYTLAFGSLLLLGGPWVAMAINIPLYSDAPEYIFVILGIQGVFFFCFGLNQWLQYRGVGRWANYGFGEKTYLVLSLAAKSLLAWQVFAASLIG